MADKPDPWARWESIRKDGRSWYLLEYGVCCWGLGTAISILLPILFFFVKPNGGIPTSAFFIAVASFVSFPIFGVLWAIRVWSLTEGRYRADREKQQMLEKVDRLEDQVEALGKRLPPSEQDTNIKS